MEVDCEIPHQLERGTSVNVDIELRRGWTSNGVPQGIEPQRGWTPSGVSTSMLTSEGDIEGCASENIEPRREWTSGSVPTRTLSPKRK